MSQSDQPGLRMRLAQEARRISGQHAYLDALERTTVRALERDDAQGMGEAVRGFAGSLEAHFHLEEQVHFPALHGLDASLGPALTELVRDHEEFRRDLEALRAAVEAPAPADRRPDLLAAFRTLTSAMAAHESREEAILGRHVTAR